MNSHQFKPFSEQLERKLAPLRERKEAIKLGNVEFSGPLLLAPMSAICSAPFRLLMEELGAGGTVSELISCHGINYKNERTMKMLRVHPDEKNVGIQLFGEDPEAMAEASKVAQDFGPKFIDINMGCPVRKVVTKGGGSALMKDPTKLGKFFSGMKKALEIPLTIKIRTGWDEDSKNAHEIVHIAKEEGVEFVAIHGRTRTQQYRGKPNWEYIENLASDAPLPIIGNGDIHESSQAKDRLEKTNCQALMLGRGPLRNPFIFLESYLRPEDHIQFLPSDYLEVIERLLDYTEQHTDRERTILTQMKKHVVWMSAGFPRVASFRNNVFKCQSVEDVMKLSHEYFLSLGGVEKKINHDQSFMAGGHG